MKAFITGVSGFVGAGLARELVQRGEEVHGLIRPGSDMWRVKDIETKITLHQGELLDELTLEAAVKAARPTIIFHFASYGTYPGKQLEPKKIFETNALGSLNVFQAAEKVGALVVNAGSSSEYGAKNHPMREDELISPESFYAVGKAAQTLLAQQLARAKKISAITLRLFSVYGPFEEPGRYVPTVINLALQGKDIPISDPAIGRDYVYLPDVVDAFLAAAKHPELSGEIINVGSGVQSTLGDVYTEVIRATGSTSKALVGAHEKRAVDSAVWVAQTDKMRIRLGLAPRFTLAQGIADMVKWLPSYASHYNR